jgi:hypothetical protein
MIVRSITDLALTNVSYELEQAQPCDQTDRLVL